MVRGIIGTIIYYLESGNGVFVSCKRQKVILPGTLLGLFPGMINNPFVPLPDDPKRGIKPYLRRFDGFWLDYEKELPYPLPAPGTNYEDYINNLLEDSKVLFSGAKILFRLEVNLILRFWKCHLNKLILMLMAIKLIILLLM